MIHIIEELQDLESRYYKEIDCSQKNTKSTTSVPYCESIKEPISIRGITYKLHCSVRYKLVFSITTIECDGDKRTFEILPDVYKETLEPIWKLYSCGILWINSKGEVIVHNHY